MSKIAKAGRRPASQKPRKVQPAHVARALLSPYLFLNPLGSYPNFTFGVLRRQYNGKTNSAAEFARLKLHPVSMPAASAPFAPTAARWECLIPPGAGDEYLDPERLFESYDANALPFRTGLLAYITFRFPHLDRLHAAFEQVRAYARAKLVLERQLPVLAIQHAPHLVGSPNAHHVHLLVLARTFCGLGWGTANDLLTSDEGQRAAYDEFRSQDWGA